MSQFVFTNPSFNNNVNSTFCKADCTIQSPVEPEDIVSVEFFAAKDLEGKIRFDKFRGEFEAFKQDLDGTTYLNDSTLKIQGVQQINWRFLDVTSTTKHRFLALSYNTNGSSNFEVELETVHAPKYYCFYRLEPMSTITNMQKPEVTFPASDSGSPITDTIQVFSANDQSLFEECRLTCVFTGATSSFTVTPDLYHRVFFYMLKTWSAVEEHSCTFSYKVDGNFVDTHTFSLFVKNDATTDLNIDTSDIITNVGQTEINFTLMKIGFSGKYIINIGPDVTDTGDTTYTCGALSVTLPDAGTAAYGYDTTNNKAKFTLTDFNRAGKYLVKVSSKNINLYLLPGVYSSHVIETVPSKIEYNTTVSINALPLDSYGNPTSFGGVPAASYYPEGDSSNVTNLSSAITETDTNIDSHPFSTCYTYNLNFPTKGKYILTLEPFNPVLTYNVTATDSTCTNNPSWPMDPEFVCHQNCTDSANYKYKHMNDCLASCPSSHPYFNVTDKICNVSCMNHATDKYRIGNNCVPSCTGTHLYFNVNDKVCYETCTDHPTDTFTDGNSCINVCPGSKPYHNTTDKVCYADCLSHPTDKFRAGTACLNACPTSQQYYNDTDKLCYANCLSHSSARYRYGNNCVNACPTGNEYANETDKICIAACIFHSSTRYTYNTECMANCPTDKNFSNSLDKVCYSDCLNHPTTKHRDNITCVSSCPSSRLYFNTTDKVCYSDCTNHATTKYNDGTNCVASCPSDKPYANATDKVCLASCLTHANDNYTDGIECVNACPGSHPYFSPDDKFCYNDCTNHPTKKHRDGNTCLATCPGSKPYFEASDKECFANCINHSSAKYNDGTNCVTSCPSNKQFASEGDKICLTECLLHASDKFTDGTECKNTCPGGKEYFDSATQTCYTNCSNITTAVHQFYKGFECFITCPSNFSFYKSNNECVAQCDGTGEDYSVGKACQPFCPPDYFEDPLKACHHPTCPTAYPYRRGIYCVTNCNSLEVYDTAKVCYDTCPSHEPFLIGVTCLAACPSKKVYAADMICVDTCPSSSNRKLGSKCLPICPPGYKTTEDTFDCVLECSSEYEFKDTFNCYKQCPGDKFIEDDHCVDTCSQEKPLLYNRTCLSACPSSHQFVLDNSCVASCLPTHNYVLSNVCVSVCPLSHRYFDPALKPAICMETCDKMRTSTHECLDNCPNDFPFHYKEDKFCLRECKFFHTLDKICLYECNTEYPYSVAINGAIYCVSNCPTGYFLHNSKCIDNCPLDSYIEGSECKDCPQMLYENSCLSKCPPAHKVIQECSDCQRRCASCSQLGLKVHEDSCVTSCPFPLVEQNNVCSHCPFFNKDGQCVLTCDSPAIPIPTLKLCITCPNGYIKEGKCIEDCPFHEYYLSGARLCINCGEEYFFEGECYPICPSGTDIVEKEKRTCIRKVVDCGLDSRFCMNSSTCVQVTPNAARCRCRKGFTSLNCQHSTSELPTHMREAFVIQLNTEEELTSTDIYILRSMQEENLPISEEIQRHILRLSYSYAKKQINILNSGLFVLIDIYFSTSK